MDIIKTDIVGDKYDVLWNDISNILKNSAPKDILILVKNYAEESAEGPQLQKMLEACKLQPRQYNILLLDSDELLAWYQLREKLDPKIIFLIGILPSQLGISSLFKLNEPNRFNDRIWLPTLSISELEQNPDFKKQLWINGMKPLFVDSN